MADRDAELAPILEEAKRIEEDALHSSQSHFEASRIWNFWNFGLGIPAAVAGAAAAASVIGEWPLAAGLLAMVAAILSTVTTFVKPNARAAACLTAGNAYNALRNDARIFRTIQCASGDPVAELRDDLHALSDRRNALNSESPSIPRRAYERGRSRIEAGETTHRVDQPKTPSRGV
jgi:hypothetical protein